MKEVKIQVMNKFALKKQNRKNSEIQTKGLNERLTFPVPGQKIN